MWNKGFYSNIIFIVKSLFCSLKGMGVSLDRVMSLNFWEFLIIFIIVFILLL